ncbi:MAG: hypothetical protein NW241_10260 [Bacteroidia bacterium]|nr:hypothetical protein [Bacteroidia bacterium]
MNRLVLFSLLLMLSLSAQGQQSLAAGAYLSTGLAGRVPQLSPWDLNRYGAEFGLFGYLPFGDRHALRGELALSGHRGPRQVVTLYNAQGLITGQDSIQAVDSQLKLSALYQFNVLKFFYLAAGLQAPLYLVKEYAGLGAAGSSPDFDPNYEDLKALNLSAPLEAGLRAGRVRLFVRYTRTIFSVRDDGGDPSIEQQACIGLSYAFLSL